jgi:hypothetical protein
MVVRRVAPLVLLMVAVCLAAGVWTVSAEVQAPNPPPGFVALFNGKDLTGWRGLVGTPVTRAKMTAEERARLQAEADALAREHWTVQDGVLVYSGKGKITLVTEKEYGNFELYVDWKIHERGDSGIYLRGSPQIQIWDPFNNPNLQNGEEKGSGSLWNNQKNPRFPDVLADNPIGQWNTFFIRMIGEKVWVDLNGKRVVDNVTMENYWERDKPIYPRGQIELQDHGNTLYFRNIYIRELP